MDPLEEAVIRAAVDLAHLESLSYSVAAPAAGLSTARRALNQAVERLVGVEPGRSREHGHVDFCVERWRSRNDFLRPVGDYCHVAGCDEPVGHPCGARGCPRGVRGDM